eukprot:740657-Rhodomonas_salina.2
MDQRGSTLWDHERSEREVALRACEEGAVAVQKLLHHDVSSQHTCCFHPSHLREESLCSGVTDRAKVVALGVRSEAGEKVDQAREILELPERLVLHVASSVSRKKRVGSERS